MDPSLLTIVFIANGVLMIAIAVPMMRRMVRPNRLYGFRTPSTLNDPELWYEVNAKTGADLLFVGVGLLVLGIADALDVLSSPIAAVAYLAWMAIGTSIAVIHGFAIIGRAKRDRR